MKLQKLAALCFLVGLVGCTPKENPLISQSPKTIPYTATPPTIDGKQDGDACWKDPEWLPINETWLGIDPDIMDFSGKFALSWSEERLYLLVKVVDDTLVDSHTDGLILYWEDDCVEIFLDEDRSGGNHQYNHNAFAYHVGLDHKVVDFNTKQKPQYFDHVKSAKTQLKNVTIWEFEIAVYDDSYSEEKENTPVKLSEGKDIGFAVAYCDSDATNTRESFVGSEKIVAEDKNIGWIDAGIFGHFRLVR